MMEFSVSCWDIWRHTTCSITLLARDVRETGLCFAGSERWPFLNVADTSASLHADGKTPVSQDCWNRDVNARASSEAASPRTLAGLKSGPHALSGLIASSCFRMPGTVKSFSSVSLKGDGGIVGKESNFSFVNTLSYWPHRACAFAVSDEHTRLFHRNSKVGLLGGNKSTFCSRDSPSWTDYYIVL